MNAACRRGAGGAERGMWGADAEQSGSPEVSANDTWMTGPIPGTRRRGRLEVRNPAAGVGDLAGVQPFWPYDRHHRTKGEQ